MSLKTVIHVTETCVRCGGASGAEIIPGDTVKLWLDQEAVPDFPEWVEAVLVYKAPQTESSTGPINYTFEYESEDLDGAATLLRDCDILSATCAGCCAIINDYLDLLAGVNLPFVELDYSWSGNTLTLQAHAWSTQIARNTNDPATIVTYVFTDPDDAVIAAGGDPDSRTFTAPADTGSTDWPGGLYTVQVTDSEGLVNTATVWVAPRPRFYYADATFTAGQASRTIVMGAGDLIVSAMALRVTEGFFIFAAVGAVLHISTAPIADLDVRVLIHRA